MRVYCKEVLEEAVLKSVSISEVMKRLGIKLSGGSHSHIKKKIKEFDIDTSHFLGKAANSGKGFDHKGGKRLCWSEVLVKRESGSRRNALLLRRSLVESGREYLCVVCNNKGEWNSAELILEVDHKNGDWLDDRAENLNFMCPNCHSQCKHKGNKGYTSKLDRRYKRPRVVTGSQAALRTPCRKA